MILLDKPTGMFGGQSAAGLLKWQIWEEEELKVKFYNLSKLFNREPKDFLKSSVREDLQIFCETRSTDLSIEDFEIFSQKIFRSSHRRPLDVFIENL